MHKLFRPLFLGCLLTSFSLFANAAPVIKELDHVVAIVNDEVITLVELQNQVKLITQRLQKNNTQLPAKDILDKQVLENIIIERIQLQLAQRSGIRVNDETVNQVIANIAQQNRLSLAEFRKVLARDGFDFASFRENIRNEITIARLRKQQVENRISVSKQEVDNHLANMANNQGLNDEYRLAHILIGVPEGATPDQIQAAKSRADQVVARLRLGADFAQTAVAESSGQNALQGGDLGWRKGSQLPPAFAELVIKLDNGEITQPIRSASGFHILKLVARRGSGQKRIVEQTMARHILIKTDEITSDSMAKQRLERIRERVLAGEDFGKIARATSDDKGSASRGGSLGWYNPGAMVPEFEEEANKLQPGQISEPFQTQFGWHIVQVMSRRNHDNTEEYQRVQARQAIGKRKSEAAVEEWLRKLRSEAYVEYRLNK